ncbi:MAG TPA: acyl-CoA dehydrogenase [Thermoanaerobaculia bacterium]|nr:acyl-CoA dehydrogenase [Thermoanaerobaculia bacterium]
MLRRLLAAADRRGLLPRLSATERQALAAGTVWVDGDLFSGRPDLARLAAEPYPQLAAAERAFLDGPLDEVCRMVDPWRLAENGELPPEVWDFLRHHRFFGLALPPEHGGLGFSALGLSSVVAKLASRSLALSVVVLIPNSVGPGELLLTHGTEEQRRRWLPRLARGEEIPCFALTETEAGSDAAALSSRGVVFRGDDGEPAIRLDWDKRYITLAPIATLLGLAVRLEDPENLLGRGREPGITLLLVEHDRPGVEVGRHHDPMGLPFPNGPTRGRGVIVGVEAIVGGAAGAGAGWRMLMEALSAGRAISLPAQAVGGAKAAARVAGAYAAVREQFGRPIGQLEGIEEPLARIAGRLYAMDAARVLTCGAVDAGHRPAVISALVKLRQTELARQITADAADVLAGAALMRGPSNPLGDAWAAVPIGITVEGANILTRTLIVFGQGAVRSHPWLGRAMAAAEARDGRRLVRTALGFAGSLVANLGRSALLSVTGGRLARAPVRGATARYWRRLAWASATFAVLADLALIGSGPGLKRRQKLSGRYTDALAGMFFTLAALRRFEAEGRQEADLPLVAWAAEEGLAEVQRAFEGILAELDTPLVGWWLRGPESWWLRLARIGRPPSDELGRRAAAVLLTRGAARDRLTADLFLAEDTADPRRRLEDAMAAAEAALPARRAIDRAVRDGRLAAATPDELVASAHDAGVIDAAQRAAILAAAAARAGVVAVDDFPPRAGRHDQGPGPAVPAGEVTEVRDATGSGVGA